MARKSYDQILDARNALDAAQSHFDGGRDGEGLEQLVKAAAMIVSAAYTAGSEQATADAIDAIRGALGGKR